MAVGTIIRFSEGMGADMYDSVIENAGFENHPPRGLIFHAAGEAEGVSRSSTSGRHGRL